MRVLFVMLCLVAGSVIAGSEPSSRLVYRDQEGVERRPLKPADKLASVSIFYWHDFPISNSYAPELNRLRAGHTNVVFYTAQVDPGLNQAAAAEHARKSALQPPVLLDPEHRLVKRFHASVTPEAVVLGKHGQLLYRGRIDNGWVALGKKRAAVTKHDLQDGLDAIAAGKPVKDPETEAVGCLIE